MWTGEGWQNIPVFFTISTASAPAGTSLLGKISHDALNLKQQVKDGDISDCEALAAFADDAASGTTLKDLFKSAFGLLVPNQSNTRNVPGIAYGAGGFIGFQSNQSGYLASYQNPPGDNSDQSHHFAAFFQLGYVYGANAGLATSVLFEQLEAWLGGTSVNQGDINLGAIAAALGAQVQSGQMKPGDVGAFIRKYLCQ